jgi:uncharacterized membrane protein
MDRLYNRIAGQSLERVAALSDGVFAVAMTLIVLEIHIPDHADIRSERALWAALTELGPHFLTYLMSFMTLGIFWVGQQTQLNHLARADRNLAWIHMGFLATVTIMPFSTSLLANFITFRVALLLYWANILAAGLLLIATWQYASRARLVKADAPPSINRAVMERIVIAQALYAVGAALCVIDTYWSIGFIALVQLNYALAPWQLFAKRGASGR